MIPSIVPKTMKIVHSYIFVISDKFVDGKLFDFSDGFKSNCISINELFYKLEGFLHSRPESKINIFPPFGNELLPPSKNIPLKN